MCLFYRDKKAPSIPPANFNHIYEGAGSAALRISELWSDPFHCRRAKDET